LSELSQLVVYATWSAAAAAGGGGGGRGGRGGAVVVLVVVHSFGATTGSQVCLRLDKSECVECAFSTL